MEADKRKEIVSALMSRGILLDRNMLTQIDSVTDMDSFHRFILDEAKSTTELSSVAEIIQKYRQRTIQLAAPETSETDENQEITGTSSVNIVFSYKAEPKKREVQDFTGYFTSRYNAIKSMLQNRKELQSLTSINRLNQKREREQTALIGIVTDKQETKTGKMMLTVEDLTGRIKVVVSPNSESYDIAKDTTLDEVLGIVGFCTGEVVFANTLVHPDIPLYKEMKKSPDEAYALFIGDFHFGSKLFLDEPFSKLISWIRGEQGKDSQKDISKKLKYVFIVGDLVDGVGIHPNQESELTILDIYEQYNGFAKHLSMIPPHIKIIVCPGNHDAMRIAEPQPPLYKDFAEAVWKLPNVTMVSNPAYVNIHASEGFPGFDILMYHGFSFTYYADNVESIRNKGGQARSDLIMEYLLKRRHLAPTHKSTLYLPDAQRDSLVIDKIPDFFITGHIHRVAAANYRNITMLNCSCWIRKTDYMEKLGIEPDPGRAILVNLQTRKVKILKFYDEKAEEKAEEKEEGKEG